jgi:hypothetical protein
MIKYTLKSQSNTLRRKVLFRRNLINGLQQDDSMNPIGIECKEDQLFGKNVCNKETGEESSCNM